MVMINNPSKINTSKSYSIVSSTLNNPFVGVEYGNFGSADPVLQSLLPNNINLGITSPGYVDDATNCTGLDYLNTNTNVDKMPFQYCLDKFTKQYNIPENVFNNLMHNLPYTFSSLSKEGKKRYIDKLNKFIEKHHHHKDNADDNNDNSKKEDFDNMIQEKYRENLSDCKNGEDLKISKYLYIIIVVVLIIIFVLFFMNFK